MKKYLVEIIFLFALLFWGQKSMAQDTILEEGTQVIIENTESLEYIEKSGKSLRKLIGNVILRQSDVKFTCDTALLDETQNNFEAFGKVHIVQADSINIYAKQLKYTHAKGKADLYGDVRLTDMVTNITSDTLEYWLPQRKAILYKGVKITDTQTQITADTLKYFTREKNAFLYGNAFLKSPDYTLKAPYMQYNYLNGAGSFDKGGELLQGDTKLSSIKGNYQPDDGLMYFEKEVVVNNPDYDLFTHQLKYNTQTGRADFSGETQIVNDSTTVFCQKGWYLSEEKTYSVWQNAKIVQQNQQIIADSLFFENEKQIGKAFGNVYYADTTQQMTLRCAYLQLLNDGKDILATEQVLLQKETAPQDTLHLVADTLVTATLDSADMREIKAFHHVKIYKQDMQAICDSLIYNEAEEEFKFLKKPIVWLDSTQLEADTILLKVLDNSPHHFNLIKRATVMSKSGGNMYDQLKGFYIDGFFEADSLKRIEVKGQAESVFFAKDDQNAYLGVNQAQAQSMKILLQNNKVDKVYFYEEPKAGFFPISQINPSEFLLPGFNWKESLRPTSLAGILRGEE
ncbi:MAG: OstA-like protein [Chitinophagales bacterium]|nr:hypothetical protein [Bacteroidota bacterium]MCB9043674.1 hypothetical protein [Chitinophagales bacterium]